MSEKAFQRIYTKLSAITKATVTLEAQGVANDELALVAGRLAQVVKIKDNAVTLQVFGGTEDIPTNAEVTFFGEPPSWSGRGRRETSDWRSFSESFQASPAFAVDSNGYRRHRFEQYFGLWPEDPVLRRPRPTL